VLLLYSESGLCTSRSTQQSVDARSRDEVRTGLQVKRYASSLWVSGREVVSVNGERDKLSRTQVGEQEVITNMILKSGASPSQVIPPMVSFNLSGTIGYDLEIVRWKQAR
jgi:hypothetical protein